MATVNTSIKIDEETKKEAQKLFKDLGLSLSAAINIFLKQAIREKGIPFYINSLPENSELAQAFEEAKKLRKILQIINRTVVQKKCLKMSWEKIKNKDHKLVNNYDGARECHITPDWLLIYEIVEDKLMLILLASGSHSELF
ncbi:type II toxin-antitoxin system RelB/DinJ family antitoxin [Leptotrichia sp. oral taxon 223]|uniref:type II toxin-antitoxin system RelB/DinJ family antitoxin n=1 Tax=Leptotrichia sp. oral taxon 223 TaxID=712363 RepID=UPI0015B79074|nr:type II toxin-antitoxin system RelB/DinJ family antitoxin [Leptotrichia sp. oral taxon 223]NWO18233.1 type II toxin-antitoxin system RelB/DinJ family antitoxin [Leptotrichia sp. oral taxon 223]